MDGTETVETEEASNQQKAMAVCFQLDLRCDECGRLAAGVQYDAPGRVLCIICGNTGTEEEYLAFVRSLPGFFTDEERLAEAMRVAKEYTAEYIAAGCPVTPAGQAMAEAYGYSGEEDVTDITDRQTERLLDGIMRTKKAFQA